jgi:hypothetical protein
VGVYCKVAMCVVADEPLPVATRVAVVSLAVEHELLVQRCSVSVPAVLPPRGIVARVKHVFGHRQMYFKSVEEGPPGPWLPERVRSIDTDFQVSSPSPRWKGESVTGPFVYRVSREAQPVTIGNAYRRDDERSPHDPPDGVIGRFFDVMTLDAKRGLDGRSAASSGFVRALKQLTGTRVICRASWY